MLQALQIIEYRILGNTNIKKIVAGRLKTMDLKEYNALNLKNFHPREDNPVIGNCIWNKLSLRYFFC